MSVSSEWESTLTFTILFTWHAVVFCNQHWILQLPMQRPFSKHIWPRYPQIYASPQPIIERGSLTHILQSVSMIKACAQFESPISVCPNLMRLTTAIFLIPITVVITTFRQVKIYVIPYRGLFDWYGLSLIPAWRSDHISKRVRWNNLSIHKLCRWSLGTDK